jgi:hypothetical protein
MMMIEKRWLVFTLIWICTATMAGQRSSRVEDGASALALPAERLVVGDAAVHSVAEQRLLLPSSPLLRHDGHLHRLAVAAGHAHPLASRGPRTNQGPPPPLHRRRLSSSHGLLSGCPCCFSPL